MQNLNEIIARAAEEVPAARGFLENYTAEQKESKVTISLAYGGAELLKIFKFDEKIKAIFREQGETVEIEFSEKTEEISEKYIERKKEEHTAVVEIKKSSKKLDKKYIAPADEYFDEEKFSDVILGERFSNKNTAIADITQNESYVCVRGEIASLEKRNVKNYMQMEFNICIKDFTSAIIVRATLFSKEARDVKKKLREGDSIKVYGKVKGDSFYNDLIIEAISVALIGRVRRKDDATEKRSELHLHTSLSTMDGITKVPAYIRAAKEWGMPAIAITDHGGVQAFPVAFSEKHKIGYEGKLILGMEGYLADDCVPVVFGESNADKNSAFVVFDVETTGLDRNKNSLIEIGAVRFENGEEKERFQTFVDPGVKIPEKIKMLTKIDDNMVSGAPDEKTAVADFLRFAEGAVLAAHNAEFDLGFIAKVDERVLDFPCIDTLWFARFACKGLKNYRLNTIAAHFKLPDFSHHRADADAATTGLILMKLFESEELSGIKDISEINARAKGNYDVKTIRTTHIILLIKNETGRKNLYELVSQSCINYFARNPRIPRSLLDTHREGLILGSACEAGELFSAVIEKKPYSELLRIADYYDYLEVQPICNNMFLIENGMAENEDELREFNKTIVKLGEDLGKPVVATSDAHFLDPEDELARRIVLAAQKFADADKPLPLYMKTTKEMLAEFAYLGEEKAREVVIYGPAKIVEQIEDVPPTPGRTLFPPEIPGCREELETKARKRAEEIYGNPLPEIVSQRLEKELGAIIGHDFAVMYIAALRLVEKSNSEGYLVGSRGSVGSSFVAFLAGITEVNSLLPHYICKKCKHSEFIHGEYEAGCDMPDKICPSCGEQYYKDGFDIPFETFLGFKGDKVPDIDLNFSGDYQAKAHKYTEELFGAENTFRAGTISTIADKTALAFVRKYYEERNTEMRYAENLALAKSVEGVKRSTGQHPGGIVVVPRGMDITDVTPVQFPADTEEKNITTTHFDYHQFESNLVKLDILGHDDPTVIRMLEDMTGVDAKTISFDDEDVLKLFSENNLPGCGNDSVLSSVASCGLPEFGTRFVRKMLEDTRPKKFGDLVRISGLSHGEDVWEGNAKELIKKGVTNLRGAICIRDDIMLYLIDNGVPAKDAFDITEKVRKGHGLSSEHEELMRSYKIPEWYIESCNKIAYMFPKAHAVAYVKMAFRIGWFKINYPEAYYAAYFTVRADDFDSTVMIGGFDKVKKQHAEFSAIPRPKDKEKRQITILEVAYEFYRRGFKFAPMDLYKSDATKFIVTENGLLPPFNSIPGLGDNAAKSIVEEREKAPFETIEDILFRTKINKTVLEKMRESGVFKGIPESAQITFF